MVVKQIDYFVQLYGRQKIEAAVSPLKALIQKSKLCFLYIKFPLRSQFKICLHLIESGQQDNLQRADPETARIDFRTVPGS